jgi:hypothetical protein
VEEAVLQRTKPGRTARTEYRWEKITFSSKDLPLFPEPNCNKYRGLPPKGLYEIIVDKELLDTIRDLSNQYAIAKFGTSYYKEEINIFFGSLLLSGQYCIFITLYCIKCTVCMSTAVFKEFATAEKDSNLSAAKFGDYGIE